MMDTCAGLLRIELFGLTQMATRKATLKKCIRRIADRFSFIWASCCVRHCERAEIQELVIREEPRELIKKSDSHDGACQEHPGAFAESLQ